MSYYLFEQKGERTVAISPDAGTWISLLQEMMKSRGYRYLLEIRGEAIGSITVIDDKKTLELFMKTHELNDYGRLRNANARIKKLEKQLEEEK